MILTLAAVTRVHARLVRAGDIWRAHWPLRVRAALIFAHQILPWVRDVRADDYASLDGRADAMTAVLVAFASEHAVFGDEFSTTLTIMEDVSQWARQVMLKAADAVGITYETVTVPEVGADPVPVVVVKKGKGPKATPTPATKAKRPARPKG